MTTRHLGSSTGQTVAMAELHLDVESLRTLLAVLDTGGMTAAAERLGVTQSAVSWKIKRLEQRVGRPLLIRDGHTVRPSRDGRALIDDARTIVELHDGAVWRLRSPDLAGTVKLGSNEEIDAGRIAAVLGRFKRSHPDATVEFVIDSSVKLRRMLERGQIDVALIQVTDADLRPDDAVLWTDTLHWVTSPEWTYDDGDVPRVTFGPDCFYQTIAEPLLRSAGIASTVAFSATTTRSVRAAVSAGLGVGVMGARHLEADDTALVDWPRGAALPPLPEVHQIARTVPGEESEVAAALVDVFTEQLDRIPPPESAAPQHGV